MRRRRPGAGRSARESLLGGGETTAFLTERAGVSSRRKETHLGTIGACEAEAAGDAAGSEGGGAGPWRDGQIEISVGGRDSRRETSRLCLVWGGNEAWGDFGRVDLHLSMEVGTKYKNSLLSRIICREMNVSRRILVTSIFFFIFTTSNFERGE